MQDADFDQLFREHCALLRAHGNAQARCSEQLQAQAREIDRLNAQVMQLRAQVIQRDTALAWAKEDRAALEQSIPGLGKRVNLARTVTALQARVHDLMDAQWQRVRRDPPRPMPDPVSLEANLAAADLVICQAGCISHGDYWRVQDHCRRTGKACVLVDKSAALRIVQIHETSDGAERALVASEQV